ncbi:hypothetical protein T492DRAFT_859105 [Pavlovales sp. CCMP2436]|nr:hypothetical protein T492DRAFT_859105 [Pavlovales sp. CCMP2436]
MLPARASLFRYGPDDISFASPSSGLVIFPALAATALALALGMRRVAARRFTESAQKAVADSSEIIEVSESEIESADHLGSLSTVNIYRGAFGTEALGQLRSRLHDVLAMNPWLAGQLAPSARTGARVALYAPHALDVHAEDICEIARQYAVDGGRPAGAHGRSKGKIFKVAALRGKDGVCALSVSLSHTIADEHTFYKIYHMLAGTEPLARLDVIRHPHAPPRDWAKSGPLAASHIISSLKPGIPVGPLLLDHAAARAAKAAHIATGEVPFISSTDVLVSALLNTLSPDVALMLVNTRGKPPHVAEATCAGNYYDPLLLCPDESPVTIRWLLGTRTPPRDDLPTLPLSLLWSLALVSSWRFGPSNFPLIGCEQLAGWPVLRRRIILFTPRESETAALVLAPNQDAVAALHSLPIVSGELEMPWPLTAQ